MKWDDTYQIRPVVLSQERRRGKGLRVGFEPYLTFYILKRSRDVKQI